MDGPQCEIKAETVFVSRDRQPAATIDGQAATANTQLSWLQEKEEGTTAAPLFREKLRILGNGRWEVLQREIQIFRPREGARTARAKPRLSFWR